MGRQLKEAGYAAKDIDLVLSMLGPDANKAAAALGLMSQLRWATYPCPHAHLSPCLRYLAEGAKALKGLQSLQTGVGL